MHNGIKAVTPFGKELFLHIGSGSSDEMARTRVDFSEPGHAKFTSDHEYPKIAKSPKGEPKPSGCIRTSKSLAGMSKSEVNCGASRANANRRYEKLPLKSSKQSSPHGRLKMSNENLKLNDVFVPKAKAKDKAKGRNFVLSPQNDKPKTIEAQRHLGKPTTVFGLDIRTGQHELQMFDEDEHVVPRIQEHSEVPLLADEFLQTAYGARTIDYFSKQLNVLKVKKSRRRL